MTNWVDLDSTYNQHKGTVVVEGSASISNQILNLFSTSGLTTTSTGERIFEPTYGASLERFLFDPFTSETAESIESYIYEQIQTYLGDVLYVTQGSISVSIDNATSSYVIVIYYFYRGKIEKTTFGLKKVQS